MTTSTASMAVTESGLDTFYATAVFTRYASLAATESTDAFAAPTFHLHVATMAAAEVGSDTLASYSLVRTAPTTLAITVTAVAVLRTIARGTMAATETGADTLNGSAGKTVSGSTLAVVATAAGVKRLAGASVCTVAVHSTAAAAKVYPGVSACSIILGATATAKSAYKGAAATGLVLRTTASAVHLRIPPSQIRASLKETGVDTFGHT